MIDTAQIPNTKLDFLSEGDRMKANLTTSSSLAVFFNLSQQHHNSTMSLIFRGLKFSISILSAIMINMAPNKMQTAEFSTTAFGAA